MTLFVDWNNLSVNQEGGFIDFGARVQVEAVYKCDSYDALSAMVAKLEASDLSHYDDLVERLERAIASARSDSFVDGAELTYDLMKEEGL